jgi:hypothetical protein
VLVIAVMLPIEKRKKAPRGAEDWPETPSDETTGKVENIRPMNHPNK